MLSNELLRMIQADRAREIAAAERVRWLHVDEAETQVDGSPGQRLTSHAAVPARRPQTGTGSTAATDPCV
jgi:hypothetical protein